MSLQLQAIPPIPEETASIALAIIMRLYLTFQKFGIFFHISQIILCYTHE